MPPKRTATEEKIQLTHPQGKKAVRISRTTYDLVRGSLTRVLKKSGGATFMELQRGVAADLRSRGAAFQGSLPWYLEWVRLDLEARGSVTRDASSVPERFRLTRKS